MKSHKYLYPKIYSFENLVIAFKKASKGKTMKKEIIEFRSDLKENLLELQKELKEETYFPKKLETFILRDPKTRKISKSDFRDRVIHHAICNIIEPIFDKTFIYDCCANRKYKGAIFGLKRFDLFKKKISKNNHRNCFVLKADIKHYFNNIDHLILINILSKKIKDQKTINLIKTILDNYSIPTWGRYKVGMPLGNLTSQFFANVYLSELDYFVKHKLKAKYYIRYVDDFVILHNSKNKLEIWKRDIDNFLKITLKIELHPEKSKILSLSRGIDFVGFRNFYYHRLLRKRNIRKMLTQIQDYKKNELCYEQLLDIYNGWQAYANWANTYKLVKKIELQIKSNINLSKSNYL